MLAWSYGSERSSLDNSHGIEKCSLDDSYRIERSSLDLDLSCGVQTSSLDYAYNIERCIPKSSDGVETFIHDCLHGWERSSLD